ncbi:Clavaminate synthase-like protein [Xylariales sp. PMI_506]|nr:Clavaminate synthase-like protein [Xylariales sp. PMI_506]
MTEIVNPTPGGGTGRLEDESQYVYFHSGSEATYRKISEKPSAFTSIPTVDLTGLDSGSLDVHRRIAKEIYDACHACGFFYIKNHGIPQHVVSETFATLKRFFELDLETKMDAHVQKNPAIRGYEPMLETRLDPRTQGDIKEAFTMGDCVIEPEQDYTGKTGQSPPSHITKSQNIWPEKAPWWREGLYNYYHYVFPLSMKLVKIFALAFDLDETAFDQYFRFPITGMRALYYPPTPISQDAASVGLGAHADFSWLTLVLQEDNVPALEVLNPNGVWVDAPPLPGTLVCNVGQYLERQTNGLFPATVHRVRNRTGQERYSLPFFLTMDPDVNLNVLECCKKPGEEHKFSPINVGDLYIRRVLPARKKHPTSIKYRDVPQEQWSYQMLLS